MMTDKDIANINYSDETALEYVSVQLTAVLMLAGMFGLVATIITGQPVWLALGGIAAVALALLPVKSLEIYSNQLPAHAW
ncbi:MAG: hypothetical protein Q4G30_10300 [Actinomycetaceae bacterium]|nr:hypothetical protein [Actinomycetaceae bacterium]